MDFVHRDSSYQDLIFRASSFCQSLPLKFDYLLIYPLTFLHRTWDSKGWHYSFLPCRQRSLLNLMLQPWRNQPTEVSVLVRTSKRSLWRMEAGSLSTMPAAIFRGEKSWLRAHLPFGYSILTPLFWNTFPLFYLCWNHFCQYSWLYIKFSEEKLPNGLTASVSLLSTEQTGLVSQKSDIDGL